MGMYYIQMYQSQQLEIMNGRQKNIKQRKSDVYRGVYTWEVFGLPVTFEFKEKVKVIH